MTQMQHPFPSYLARSWSAINLTDNLVRKSVASFANTLHSILMTIPGSLFVRLAYKRPEPVADTFLRHGLILAKKGWGGGERAKKNARKREVSIPPAGSRGHTAPLTRNRGGKLFPADALRQRTGPEIAHLGVWSVSPVIFDGLL